jgi:hypothetical protein
MLMCGVRIWQSYSNGDSDPAIEMYALQIVNVAIINHNPVLEVYKAI